MDTEDQESDEDVEVILETSTNGPQDSSSKESKDTAKATVPPNKVRLLWCFFQIFRCSTIVQESIVTQEVPMDIDHGMSRFPSQSIAWNSYFF